jgi:hypothetical protein
MGSVGTITYSTELQRCSIAVGSNVWMKMTMASGYEKSPEYGGPTPTWWGSLVLVLFVAILAGLLVYLRVI